MEHFNYLTTTTTLCRASQTLDPPPQFDANFKLDLLFHLQTQSHIATPTQSADLPLLYTVESEMIAMVLMCEFRGVCQRQNQIHANHKSRNMLVLSAVRKQPASGHIACTPPHK